MLDVATLVGDALLAAATAGVGYVGRKHHTNQKQLEENSRKLEVLTDDDLNKKIRIEVARQLRTEYGARLRKSLDAVLGNHGMDVDDT